ncbi:MAG: hypothetical protein L0228_15980 [Planctomycetes bacterium]|nr:hypothetical protein [Planctomycetota bacterium]
MRHSLVGAVLIAGLVIAATAARSSSEPPYAPPVEPAHVGSGELIAHVTAADGVPQIVTVIDPRQRVMAVYHVDRATGQITPKSIRNFTWDLQMIEFNSGDPLPQDVRSGLQR